MPKPVLWEYLVRVYVDRDPARPGIDEHFARALSNYGCDGWELVSLLHGNSPSFAVPVIRCVFKRPKPWSKPAKPPVSASLRVLLLALGVGSIGLGLALYRRGKPDA